MKVDVRDEFKDLMKEETKQQLSIRYDEKTLRNKEKMEQIQKDMRLANKVQRYDDNDVEEEDEYEDYFNNKMNEDLGIVQENSDNIDYFSALKKINSHIELNNDANES